MQRHTALALQGEFQQHQQQQAMCTAPAQTIMPAMASRYVLAEFAAEVVERAPHELAEELASRLDSVPVATHALLLTALLKLRFAAPEHKALRARAEAAFRAAARSHDTDVQQRAVEYLAMSRLGDSSLVVADEVMAPMPEWREQGLLVMAADGEEGSPGDGEQNGDNGASIAASRLADGGAQAQGEQPAARGASGAVSPVGTLEVGSSAGGTEAARSPRTPGDGGARLARGDAGNESPGTPDIIPSEDAFPKPRASINLVDLSSPGELPPAVLAGADAPDAAQAPGMAGSAGAALVPPLRLAAPAAPAADEAGATAAAAAAQADAGDAARCVQLLYSSKGLLLEEAHLQVGFVAEPAGPSHILHLYCGNKSATRPLDAFSVLTQPHAAYQLSAAPAPGILLPQQQVTVAVHTTPTSLAAALARPRPPPPTVQLSYAAGGKVHRHAVQLPLALPHFARPHSHLSQAWFFSAWSVAASAPDRRAAVMTQLTTPLASAATLGGYMYHMGFWDGGVRLDPTEELNYAGATSLAGVDVLARVEVNSADHAQVHTTVVATQGVPNVAETMLEWVSQGLAYLSSLPLPA
jgi:hypothetical protein